MGFLSFFIDFGLGINNRINDFKSIIILSAMQGEEGGFIRRLLPYFSRPWRRFSSPAAQFQFGSCDE
jgi:hypothetical protein